MLLSKLMAIALHLSATLSQNKLLNLPLLLVIVLSLIVGCLMVLLFGYTSDQKKIGIAKDQLKAHLLAVRLYRDQIPVVIGSYGKILGGVARYLKLAFIPLLYVIIPITLLVVQVDRYLGSEPIPPKVPFLLTVRTTSSNALDSVTLELPTELNTTAPPVHILADREIVWRLAGSRPGKYELNVVIGGRRAGKSVCIGEDLPKISTVRLRAHFLERMFSSAEPALPEDSQIDSISVQYPERRILVAGYGVNWIWLFFILSMAAGFVFKEILGVNI